MVPTAHTQREIFLMSPPGPEWQLRGRANFRSDAANQVDASIALREWQSLVQAIEEAGGQVLVLPPDDSMTGLPYCAEAGHPLPPEGADERPRFLLPRMWAEHRVREVELWAPFVESLGFRAIPIQSGFWEGQGDVAHFRDKEILFYGGRTDKEGLASVRQHFSGSALCLEVRQPAFHGNVALLSVDDCDCLVVCPELFVGDAIEQLRDSFGQERLLRISEEEARGYATNALPVGSRLLAPSLAPKRVLRELADRGMTIVSLEMAELCEKAGGASRCLVCRVPGHVAAGLTVSELPLGPKSHRPLMPKRPPQDPAQGA